MKKVIFILSILFFLSCEKNENTDISIPESVLTADKVYKETGCTPQNVSNIKEYHLFTDGSGNKFLYGSKIKDNNVSFWIAGYYPDGSQKWEIIKDNNKYWSKAENPNIIHNGNLVIANTLYENEFTDLPFDSSPVLIDINTGKTKFIKIFDKYIYTNITSFDNFFFCTINREMLEKNPHSTDYSSQIDNDGNVIRWSGTMNIPEGYALWPNDSIFISITTSLIYMEHVIRSGYKWKFYPSLLSDIKYDISALFNKDTVSVSYKSSQDTVVYKLSYFTGIEYKINYKNYTYLDFDKNYISPDSMTVNVHVIDVSDRGDDNLYYLISYTLSNNTKTKTISEGIFESYNQNFERVSFQTGFFGSMSPGKSKNGVYVFETSKDKPLKFVSYRYDLKASESAILDNSLKWGTPKIK